MIIAAQTKFSEVIDQINEVLSKGTYADPDDFALRAILRDCKRVRDVDPARGWGLLGCYYSVLGDAAEVDRCFRASQDLAHLNVVCENYHANLVNLGYFSRAHEFFKSRAHPKSGMFSGMGRVAFSSGSIHTFLSFYETAVAMNLEMPELPAAKAARAAAVLKKAGLSDEHATRHLDAAGAVLRRHKLFHEQDVRLEVADEPGVFMGVTCIFRLRRSAEEVFELNLELAAEEDEMMVDKSPAFDVLFLPV